jgi:hypothetical protein
MDFHDTQPEEEVFPELSLSDLGQEIRMGRRTTTLSCRTRSNLAWIARGASPISSRKMVPPEASSNLPSRWSTPVATPRSMPKSSLSSKLSGTAAQLIAMKGPSHLVEPACRSFAASSFPVPLSPRIKTLALDAAARLIISLTRRIGAESPTSKSPA